MKKLLFLCATTAVLASCGMTSGTSTGASSTSTATTVATTVSAATSAGQNTGNAIHLLYTQYKADGKYDYKNVNNAINAALLLANCADLPKNVKNSTYLKEFGQGLITSSAGLVTQQNVASVTDNLTTIASEYANTAAAKTSEAANGVATTTGDISGKLQTAATTASSVASLLSMFGK